MTDGMKTSEFWITLLVTGLAFVVSTGVLSPEQSQEIAESGTEIINRGFDLIAVVLPVMGYSISRGIAKNS